MWRLLQVAVTVLLALGLVAFTAVGIIFASGPLSGADLRRAQNAITQCEQSLPRDKHCEIVITARVVEEKP